MVEGRRRSSYRYVIAGLTVWAHFAGGASFAVVAPVLPLITDDYGISHTSAGLLVGVVTLIQAIFGGPGRDTGRPHRHQEDLRLAPGS